MVIILRQSLNDLFFSNNDNKNKIDDIQNDIIQLDLAQITPNPFQPRLEFDDEKIVELSQTLKTHGIIQPIVVRSEERRVGKEGRSRTGMCGETEIDKN